MVTPSGGAWFRAASGAATTTPTATAATIAWPAQLRSEGRFICSSRDRHPPHQRPHGSMFMRTDGYIPVRSSSREVNEATPVESRRMQAERRDRREQPRHRRAARPVDAGIALVALVVVAAAALRPLLDHLLDRPAVAHWATVFVAITVQAMPFLVLGVVISAAVAAFVPAGFLPRALPRRPALAVPLAAAAGAALPSTAQHDLLQAGGFLIVGAATAATLQTVVPRGIIDAVAGAGPLALLALAGLAVVMAICSEADAFVAASLTQFSLTARLGFMVVGPMVDVKLVALQAGTFGRRFAVRCAPLTLVVALVCSALVGRWLL